jgi:hypothetical protein
LRGVSCDELSLKPPTYASKRRMGLLEWTDPDAEGCGNFTGLTPSLLYRD